uniref:Uncharacterized protein n=1 Tax=Rhizophora mucronata TaxID=61149 RepID=A0A2P2ITZ9_RHIMU
MDANLSLKLLTIALGKLRWVRTLQGTSRQWANSSPLQRCLESELDPTQLICTDMSIKVTSEPA